MAGDHKKAVHASLKAYKPKTWYQKYILSWQYHKDQTGRNLPQGIALGKQSFFGKILPVPGLILTTILCVAILYGIDQPPLIDNGFYDFVSTHRSSVQAILSLSTSVLSFAHLPTPTLCLSMPNPILIQQAGEL